MRGREPGRMYDTDAKYKCCHCGKSKPADAFYLRKGARGMMVTSECKACKKVRATKNVQRQDVGLLSLDPLPYKVVGGTRRCANKVYAYAQHIQVEVTKEPHGVMIHRPKGEVRPNTLGIFDSRVDILTLRFLFA